MSQRTDISSLKAINTLAQNYDGLKVGVQLEKTK
ncbi:MAG: lipocalin-like domain-containing protein [Bacteroides sp.]